MPTQERLRKVDVVSYYRKHDDFKRYSINNKKRVNELSKIYSENRRFFGKRVLDLACGGGVLASILRKHGHEYLGIDKNPDMIRKAEELIGSNQSEIKFLRADARIVELESYFDTVTLLGNAVIHFDTSELSLILKNVSRILKAGESYFIVDYRDIVSMLYTGDWNPRETFNRTDMMTGKVIGSKCIGIDPISGNIKIQSLVDGRKNLIFTHAMWSPFIIQPIMEARGFELVKRQKKSEGWLDVYKYSLQ